MKYYSEYTKKMYDSVGELTEAENKAKQEELTKRENERQLKEAYEDAVKAVEHFLKLKGYEDPDFQIILKGKRVDREPLSFEDFVRNFFK